ncbi:MAG: hypothetical protein AAF809_02800 [Bacteroidota bacterium]
MSRIASLSALWLLLGFVLGGTVAPALHAIQHANEEHATECAHAESRHAHADRHAHVEHEHAPALSHPVTVAEGSSASPCFACALCAVQLTSTTAEAAAVPLASCAEGALDLAAASVPGSPTAAPYAPRGPPAS